MADTGYITKESALSCFHDWIDRYGHEHTADEMVEYQRIEDLPAADVRPVVRGTWRERRFSEDVYGAECSVCHTTWDYGTNFCPNCGADMRGEQCSPLRDGTAGG